ncbi:MAG: ATP-dependent Clp protease adaptor ClpS [Sphingobacteriales bacterium JAD_PAG50586_3]|nr:MAG: ATP-dependent Clp protease adaptor ClpS [Sphingobacteriales bacterium JAD_PAG50586_3]
MKTISSGIFLIDTDTLVEVDELLDTGVKRNLVLHNDDYNTFEYVIETLIEVCDHTVEQAEQCTYIVHYNGKCVVKLGTVEELKPIYQAIQDRGLTVEID